jgi:hypothetical protein
MKLQTQIRNQITTYEMKIKKIKPVSNKMKVEGRALGVTCQANQGACLACWRA